MKDVVVSLLAKELKESVASIDRVLEVPPKLHLGDFAFPCFSLAKKQRKNPLEIAQDLCEKLRKKLPKEISNVASNAAYVNFFVDKALLAKAVLKSVGKKSFGTNNSKKGKRIVIEFSQPNTHKAFHVGHIRGTSIGESLARISEACSEKVVRVNYSGDTGMHIAKWIWCYQKHHSKEPLQKDESWIASIYVDAVRRLAEDESLQSEVDAINKKIEDKSDKEINALWEKTRQYSITAWNRIYSELNTSFDKHYFESEMEIPGKMVAEELLKKKIAKKDDAIFMDLKEQGKGVWVLLRRDGTVLYSAKDLALAKQKVSDFKADEYLVTVGDEQRLHFEQLVETLQMMKFPKAEVYKFLAFGMVRLPEGKMSSRTGNNVLYSDFLQEVVRIAQKGLEQRGCSQDEIDERALTIAIAAIKYSMLKQDPRKSMIFNPEEAIAFEGDTGPYLLYSYARANSISRKVKSDKPVKIVDLKDEEVLLTKQIDMFPHIVQKACDALAPNLIANYAFDLSKLFNEFYHSCPVRGSVEEGFRLRLVEAFRITLKKSLDLLGIEVLEEM